MRAPDLAAIAAHYAELGNVGTRNAWLHRLLVHLGKRPKDERVGFQALLDDLKVTGPIDFDFQDSLTVATHLKHMHHQKWPLILMNANGLCLCIQEIMMDIEG